MNLYIVYGETIMAIVAACHTTEAQVIAEQAGITVRHISYIGKTSMYDIPILIDQGLWVNQ